MGSDRSQLVNGSIVLVTGPMAAGKSTIAEALAATFPKGVHVEGDVFRRFIVSGRHEIGPSPSEDALAQLRLRYRLTADAAQRYAKAGYTVAVEDVVAARCSVSLWRCSATAPASRRAPTRRADNRAS